ncbi:DUF4267 domain-containing protein [Phytomonospora sp. NPDC050363]|uniref:DUF4267 domain-containing protein n=1 Tax=Phytomonospora sp. NPDC050363 TaxID=3155642 RepID=UPI0033F99668
MSSSTLAQPATATAPATTGPRHRRLAIASHILVGLLVLFVFWFGSYYVLDPHTAVIGFGLPESTWPTGDMTAFMTIKGVRDLGTGLALLVLLVTRQTRAVGWALIAMAFIPLGDMSIILSYDGSIAAALGIHAATALTMLVVGGFIAWNERARKNV